MCAAAPSRAHPVCIVNSCFSDNEQLKGLLDRIQAHFTVRMARATSGLLRDASMRFVRNQLRPVDVCARILFAKPAAGTKPLSQQVREINFDSQSSTRMICCMRAQAADWALLSSIQADLHPDVAMLFYKDDADLVRLLLKQLKALQVDTQEAVERSCLQRPGAKMTTEDTAGLLADCIADMDGSGEEQSLAFELTTALHGMGSVQQLVAADSDAAARASALSDRSVQRLASFLHGSDQKTSRLQ